MTAVHVVSVLFYCLLFFFLMTGTWVVMATNSSLVWPVFWRSFVPGPKRFWHWLSVWVMVERRGALAIVFHLSVCPRKLGGIKVFFCLRRRYRRRKVVCVCLPFLWANRWAFSNRIQVDFQKKTMTTMRRKRRRGTSTTLLSIWKEVNR